ncbi:hypothetical protein pipiens_006676 [Culex pipiens pipiens]|uniref:Uncharacterized protein n=1 Tax=Culex pipiens pipiens TaxID=38569 RepID=A0ABD1DP15_CULPP
MVYQSSELVEPICKCAEFVIFVSLSKESLLRIIRTPFFCCCCAAQVYTSFQEPSSTLGAFNQIQIWQI